jgi:hypothetical protein
VFSKIRHIGVDSSYKYLQDDGFRHEVKYALSLYEYLKFRDFCMGFMDYDKNAEADGEYIVKSHYFDTVYFSDYNEKLNGIYDRQKYRLRTYGDSGYYRLEKKIKKGLLNKKISGEISCDHAEMLILGKMNIKTGDDTTDAIISEMYFKDCRKSVYIEYKRQAFTMKELDLRITFDKDLSMLYGNYGINEAKPGLYPCFYECEAVLEIKYKDLLPRWIEKTVRRIVPSEYSISKYAESLRNVLR